jgi:hypothetical protein
MSLSPASLYSLKWPDFLKRINKLQIIKKHPKGQIVNSNSIQGILTNWSRIQLETVRRANQIEPMSKVRSKERSASGLGVAPILCDAQYDI